MLLQEVTARYFASVAQMGMDYNHLVQCSLHFGKLLAETHDARAWMQSRFEKLHLETFGTPLVAED